MTLPEEIECTGRVISTSHVVLQVWSENSNVGGGVSDGDVAVPLTVTIGLHVPSSGLDVRSSNAVGTTVDQLIADKEAGNVVVGVKGVDNLGESIVLGAVPGRFAGEDICVESVEVQEYVDAGILKCLHAAVVVGRGVNVVDTNGISAQRFHECGIELTLVGVHERVVRQKLVGDTLDKPLIAIASEELGAFC